MFFCGTLASSGCRCGSRSARKRCPISEIAFNHSLSPSICLLDARRMCLYYPLYKYEYIMAHIEKISASEISASSQSLGIKFRGSLFKFIFTNSTNKTPSARLSRWYARSHPPYTCMEQHIWKIREVNGRKQRTLILRAFLKKILLLETILLCNVIRFTYFTFFSSFFHCEHNFNNKLWLAE